jgi:hypothetical protein
VSRFRSSHHCAGELFCQQIYDSSAVFGFDAPMRSPLFVRNFDPMAPGSRPGARENMMFRAGRFALAAIAMSIVVAACSSSDLFKPSAPPTQALQFESQPPGAEVRTAQGQTCQAPCSLAVPAVSQSVSFSMNGFLPQTVQVAAREPADHSWFASTPPQLVPNPVVAALQPAAPPPPPPRKLKPHPRRPVAHAPSAAPAAPVSGAPPAATAPQDSAFPPPPPMTAPAPSPFPSQPPATR